MMFKKSLPAGRQGFTLIELMVVMGIMAVLAAGVVALINPADKIKSANDATIQAKVGETATAAQSFAARNNGGYPTIIGDLSAELVPIPAGITVTGYGAAGCTTAGPTYCPYVTVYGALTSAKYNPTTNPKPRWLYDSQYNVTCAVTSTTTQLTSATCP